MNSQSLSSEKILFKQKRDDIALLYSLYVDYVQAHKYDAVPYVVPDRFTLVSGFAEIFLDVDVVCGHHGFIAIYDAKSTTATIMLSHHYWLTWRRMYIIDLLPLDGEFELSVPQIVFQSPPKMRFFASKGLFPKEWGMEEKMSFEARLNDLVEILTKLQQKVPL